RRLGRPKVDSKPREKLLILARGTVVTRGSYPLVFGLCREKERRGGGRRRRRRGLHQSRRRRLRFRTRTSQDYHG
ncbi:unnamed protein product, partial [Linum tenue]